MEQGCASILENLADTNNNESIRDLAQQIDQQYFGGASSNLMDNMTSGAFGGGGGQGYEGDSGNNGEFNF